MTKTEVKQEVEKLLKANSLCPEGREAVQAYLEAYGTANEKGKAEALLQELEEDITSIDDLICLLYTSPSPRDSTSSRMPSSA